MPAINPVSSSPLGGNPLGGIPLAAGRPRAETMRPTISGDPMAQTIVHTVTVQFGDCDPAGIVFFPNFARWMDAASLNFFLSNGVPPWRELQRTRGIVGTPVLETATRYLKTATYGETLHIHTSVIEWRAKTFTHRHVVYRGVDILCEGTEVRAFVAHDAQTERMRAVPVPDDIRALCL